MPERLENIVFCENIWTMDYYREEEQCLMWKTNVFDTQINVMTKSNVKCKSYDSHTKNFTLSTVHKK